MSTSLKKIVLAIVMMVVPLHSIAAVGQLSCGSLAVSQANPAGSKHTWHDDEADRRPSGISLSHATTETSEDASNSTNAPLPGTTHSQESLACSTCVLHCHFSSALSVTQALIAARVGAEPVNITPLLPFTGYIPAILERPPKRLLLI